MNHQQQPIWETFAETEQRKHHFQNNVRDRMKHVLDSLRYASHLCSTLQRFDLALALVRAAETHINWMWELEKNEGIKELIRASAGPISSITTTMNEQQQEEEEEEPTSPTTISRRDFVASLRSASTAAIKLRTLCESKIMMKNNNVNNNNINSNSISNLWMKSKSRFLKKVHNGTAEEFSLNDVIQVSSFKNNNSDDDEDDLFWILSQLQMYQQQLQSSSLSLQDRRRKEALLRKLEDGVLKLHRSIENVEENTKDSYLIVVKTTFLAQALLLLGTSFSSFRYLIASLDEVRKLLALHENTDNKIQQQQQHIEKITASCIIEISNQLLELNDEDFDDDDDDQRTDGEESCFTSSSTENDYLVSNEEDDDEESAKTKEEFRFIKRIQTFVLLVEVIATLCRSLEHKNHTSSPNTDSLLVDLYSLWMKLSEEVELLVEYGFVKGRGQSRVRGRDFSNWLNKYRFEIQDFDYCPSTPPDQEEQQSSNNNRNSTRGSAKKKKMQSDENNSIIVEDWFDIMRNRIRLLKVARE